MNILNEENILDESEIWDEIKAEELLNVCIESIMNGGILEILISNVNYNYKIIIYNEFKNICNYILYAYRTYNYSLMKKCIIKLSKLYDFINTNELEMNL